MEQVKEDGLYKAERIITTAQQPQIAVNTGEDVVNFCANNYLGLANHPELIAAAKTGLDEHGFGMAS
ncbi:MAG TPA: glycine C-acetyltransferase, partial [Colwellia sp.]|nr:glycine C-acetyltransferase [Colwellia sp.]